MTYNDLDIPNNVKVALDSIVDWATTGDNTKGFKEYALTYVNALPSAAITDSPGTRRGPTRATSNIS